MTSRKFKCSVPVMLIAALTAAKNMKASLASFADDYPSWTDEEISKFIEEIISVSELIGIKGITEQHEATLKVRRASQKAIDAAFVVQNQIKGGYKKEKERMLQLQQLLGFSKDWKKARMGNQSALLSLLHTFINNMNEDIQAELIEHGITQHRITELKTQSKVLIVLNSDQEKLKSASPAITAGMNSRLNEIYDRVMDICLAGKTVFRKNPVIKAQFSFTRLVAQQTSSNKPKKDEGENSSTPIE